MAYLTFNATEDKQNTCFKFIGSNNTQSTSVSLITGETVGTVALISPNSDSESGLDTCSFYSGPSDSTIMAFGESNETVGTVAYADGGSYSSTSGISSGESCGVVASSSSGVSSGSCGGCSYSC